MRRSIWIGAAILLAAAAAVPLWLSLDDGSRNQAALAETTETEAVDCERARDAEACAELNRILLDLDGQLAEIGRRQQSVERYQDAITRNAHYVAATNDELSEELALDLQLYMERRANSFQTLSDIMKKLSETYQAIADNIK